MVVELEVGVSLQYFLLKQFLGLLVLLTEHQISHLQSHCQQQLLPFLLYRLLLLLLPGNFLRGTTLPEIQ